MHHRLFRTILLLSCLLGSLLVSGALATRVATSTPHAGRSFRPSGHGVVIPQVVDTATMPQLPASQLPSASIIPQWAVSSAPLHKTLASLSNVVNVPPLPAPTPPPRPAYLLRLNPNQDAIPIVV